MKSGKKFLLTAVLFAVIGLGSELAAADYKVSDEPVGYENYWNCVSRKLGRGVSNFGFGVCEIPIRVYSVNFEEGGIAGLTFGLFNGIGWFVARELVGVFEVVTFLCPMPFTPNDHLHGEGWGFGPIMTPEWVFTPETDPWNLFYQDAEFHQ